MTRVADEALLLLRMDTDIAPADLASGRAVPVGAECHRGVHDAPPGCAWKHCHEKYVWTPVCFTTSPHHGLVWSYLSLRGADNPSSRPHSSRFCLSTRRTLIPYNEENPMLSEPVSQGLALLSKCGRCEKVGEI